MPAFKFIIVIFALIIIAFFAAKNMTSVEISYYDSSLDTQTTTLPLMVVVLGPFGAGFILAWLIEFFNRIKLKSTLRRQNKTIDSLQEELDRLKAQTHAPDPSGVPRED